MFYRSGRKYLLQKNKGVSHVNTAVVQTSVLGPVVGAVAMMISGFSW
jgi:hypothetical protein